MLKGLYFSKKIFDYFWYDTININVTSVLNRFRTLHSVCLSWPSLTVSENRTVIPLKSFVNHWLNLAFFINILLRCWMIKKIIELKLSQSWALLFDINLLPLLINLNKRIFRTILFLWWKKRSYPDCCFYFIRHFKQINLISSFIWFDSLISQFN